MLYFNYSKFSKIDQFFKIQTSISKYYENCTQDVRALLPSIQLPQTLIQHEHLDQNLTQQQTITSENPIFQEIQHTIIQLSNYLNILLCFDITNDSSNNNNLSNNNNRSNNNNNHIIYNNISDSSGELKELLSQLIKYYNDWIAEFIQRVESKEDFNLMVNKVYMIGEDLEYRQIQIDQAYKIVCYDTTVHRFIGRNSSGLSVGGVYQDYYFKIDPNNSGLLRPAKENAVFEFYNLLFNGNSGSNSGDGSNGTQQKLISKTELLIYSNLPILSSESSVYSKVQRLINIKMDEIMDLIISRLETHSLTSKMVKNF